MKIVFFFLLVFQVFWVSISFGQGNTFTDPRDNKVYPIVEVGELHWLGTNLQYHSEDSWCKDHPKHKMCASTNYYSNTSLDSVCPTGWRIPTFPEWQAAVNHYMEKNGIHPDSISVDSSKFNRASILVSGVEIYNDSSGLHFYRTGWVQGKRLHFGRFPRKVAPTTIWIQEPETQDPTTHIHLGPFGYTKHGHDHSIVDKPSRIRRFAVRCVREG